MHALRVPFVFLLALSAAPAFADCAQRIDALDQRVKSTPLDARIAPVFSQVRKSAVDLCNAGQETTAMQTVQMLEGMLSAPASTASAKPEKPSGTTLNDMDYTGGRQPIQREYLNPWDALSGRQICDWLGADEIEKALGLAADLKTTRDHWRCSYRFLMPNDRSAIAFSFYVEPHDDPNYPREAEARMSTGSASSVFEPFTPATPLLNGYNSIHNNYMYIYPQGGMTLWELRFLADSPEKDVLFGSAPQPANLGKAFLDLLIDKHRHQIEAGN